jgi:hypothetical protein
MKVEDWMKEIYNSKGCEIVNNGVYALKPVGLADFGDVN